MGSSRVIPDGPEDGRRKNRYGREVWSRPVNRCQSVDGKPTQFIVIGAVGRHLSGRYEVAGQINVEIADRGHAPIDQTVHRDGDSELFPNFSNQGELGSLVVVNLSARKLPLARSGLARRSFTGEYLAIPVKDRRYYFDPRQWGSLSARFTSGSRPYLQFVRLPSHIAPVGEARRVVPAQVGVLEQPPADVAVAGRAGYVVDGVERQHRDDVR